MRKHAARFNSDQDEWGAAAVTMRWASGRHQCAPDADGDRPLAVFVKVCVVCDESEAEPESRWVSHSHRIAILLVSQQRIYKVSKANIKTSKACSLNSH